jgi:SNF2 family DNA or RNA helicase
VNPGTPWIPDSVYSDFAAYMLGTINRDWRKAVEVTRNADTGNFTVELKEKYLKSNSYNTQKWGTSRRSFLDLFDAMLNSKSVVVKYKTDDGKTVVDQDATAAANEKVEAIQKEFQEWLWKDEGRRTELAALYNETFNSIVTPKYNGDNLTVNGANSMKPLRPHQRNAVQRIIASGGNTLLAHKVGAGKTYEMAAAAMKLKELGLVKKPMFAVPKSLVAQWGNEFMDFFPTAKLLVAEASDFTAANRKVFMNRIANGDYDAVIVSYEQFERLPMSADFTRELYQEQIDSVIWAIEEAKVEKGGKSLSVKDLEKKRKQLQTKIDKLTDTAKDEDNIDFEQLGVDSIFVDEAHNFKNLFYTTSMTNVSGLGNKDGSKRAFDLYTKVRYLQKLNGGRGIVFATATPVMNSMSEMYIMQKYLQPDLLDQLGLSTFDAWAKQFGEVVNGVEIKPSGQGYRVKQSFSRFKNMSELQLLFRNFADVLTDIPGLKIPKMKGGKVNVVVCEPGQFQQDYMKELEKRADNIKNVDPSIDNMLKITSDGRKISYTQRMIDPSLPYEEGCKIYRCADNVLVKYQESKEIKGTQIIFCDMATPKGKSSSAATETEEIETDMESAKLYDDIKARLVKGGIPAKEIAFIHEADTDAKKKKLFADVNDGKVRVLIGSTGKMGVGMNAQKRIVAIHHLDAPWRPGDVEQRNGRAYRQGNINDEVENFTYVTEGSFDARLWDILDRKQSFINQVMNGENVGRETEDTGEVTLSAAEVKALASGSPLIMEQVQLDTDIKKLESLYRAHRSAVANAKGRLETDKGNIATYEKFVANGKKDLSARVDTYSEGKFSITIGKQKFTDKKDAGAQLMAEATAKANEEGYTTIGKFAGFDLRVIKTHEGIKGQISGNQAYSFNTYPANTTYMISHLIAKVEAIDEAVKLWEHKISEAKQDMAEQEKLFNQPFAKQAELDKKRARYNEVMEILNPKEEQALDNMDEDAVQ